MVMFNRSLRAVFRKESWMFCADLLLSIADLLKVLRPPNITLPLPQTPQGKFQSTACSSRTSRLRNMGGQPASSPPGFPRLRRPAGSCEDHTASPSAFQPRSCEKVLRLFYSVQTSRVFR